MRLCLCQGLIAFLKQFNYAFPICNLYKNSVDIRNDKRVKRFIKDDGNEKKRLILAYLECFCNKMKFNLITYISSFCIELRGLPFIQRKTHAHTHSRTHTHTHNPTVSLSPVWNCISPSSAVKRRFLQAFTRWTSIVPFMPN